MFLPVAHSRYKLEHPKLSFAAYEGNCRKQALAQVCAVCSPKTKVNECNRDITPAILLRYRQLLGFH
jgi:hypothetical protein